MAINFRRAVSRFLGISHGGKRDLYDVCGYEKEITVDMYRDMFARNGLAKRICKAFPSATWRDIPILCDDNGSSPDDSAFVQSWVDFAESSKFLSFFKRADVLSQVGHFSLCYLGFSDVRTIDDLVKPLRIGKNELIYFSVYSEKQVTHIEYDQDVTSPRYGLPLFYTVSVTTAQGDRSQQRRVHFSRCLHFAEHLEDNEFFSTPYLEAGFNYLVDIQKVMGSSAETFWLNANRGIAWEIDPEASISEEDIAKLKDQAEEFTNQLRRNVVLSGVNANSLPTQVSDPTQNVMMNLKLLAGTYNFPLRILIGNEAGQLASSQDENNWLARVDERKSNYATPCILVPFVELMVVTGNIIAPSGKWSAKWASTAGLSPDQKADIAVKKTSALNSYLSAMGAEEVVPIPVFRQWLDVEVAEEDEVDLEDDEDDILDESDEDVQAAFEDAREDEPDA